MIGRKLRPRICLSRRIVLQLYGKTSFPSLFELWAIGLTLWFIDQYNAGKVTPISSRKTATEACHGKDLIPKHISGSNLKSERFQLRRSKGFAVENYLGEAQVAGGPTGTIITAAGGCEAEF